MDRLDALPFPQKALIGFLLMALMAGAGYFLVIADVEAAIVGSTSQLQKSQAKLAQLKKYEDGKLLADLRAEEDELKEQLAANKALLPEDEKIPALITSIKRQADERGLKINLFAKGQRQSEDYVDLIPVDMEVEGSFPVVVSFFEALAQPGMRMMTVNDLTIEAFDVKSLMEKSGGKKRGERPPPGKNQPKSSKDGSGKQGTNRGTGPLETFLGELDAYEKATENMRVTATFTVYAFSYTGGLLSAEERKKRGKKRKKRKKRRR